MLRILSYLFILQKTHEIPLWSQVKKQKISTKHLGQKTVKIPHREHW
jgi:hypothetical protein